MPRQLKRAREDADDGQEPARKPERTSPKKDPGLRTRDGRSIAHAVRAQEGEHPADEPDLRPEDDRRPDKVRVDASEIGRTLQSEEDAKQEPEGGEGEKKVALGWRPGTFGYPAPSVSEVRRRLGAAADAGATGRGQRA